MKNLKLNIELKSAKSKFYFISAAISDFNAECCSFNGIYSGQSQGNFVQTSC